MSTPAFSSLSAYTRKFAALIDAGVSLAHSLGILQTMTEDRDLAAANADLTHRVCQQDQTLSEAMRAHPDVFPPIYIAFVHAGEIGGVLDETLDDLADWFEQEQAADQRLRTLQLLTRVASKVLGPEVPDWNEEEVQAAISRSRQVARVASFCRLFERCLSAGVPLRLALTTAGEVLGDDVAARLLEAAAGLGEDAPLHHALAQVAELPPLVADMVAIGEETASLEHMLRKVAQFLDAEAARLLHEAARV